MFKNALLSLTLALSLLTPSTLAVDAACGVVIRPQYFYGISSTTPTTNTPLGPLGSPPDTYYNFKVSQTGTGTTLTAQSDLIAVFNNIPYTPRTLEFTFEPISDQSFTGYTKVDVFKLNELPRDGSGKPVPTWDNLKGKTGALVGSFTLTVGSARQRIRIGDVGTSDYFRVSINDAGFKSGEVGYPQDYAFYTTGLKVRSGC